MSEEVVSDDFSKIFIEMKRRGYTITYTLDLVDIIRPDGVVAIRASKDGSPPGSWENFLQACKNVWE